MKSGLFSLLILPNTFKLRVSSVNFIDPMHFSGSTVLIVLGYNHHIYVAVHWCWPEKKGDKNSTWSIILFIFKYKSPLGARLYIT